MDFLLSQSRKKQKNFCGSAVKLLSPAKINLYLNILGKYKNGFHEIESIVERINLFDRIEISCNNTGKFIITTNLPSLNNNKNLCLQAAKLLVQEYNLSYGVEIKLFKQIPVGAGLGGGSSNAATVLLGLNKILKLNLSLGELFILGARLGSDVNFFLAQTSFALIKGKGEIVIPFQGKKLFHYIIWPKIFVSTAQVYKNLARLNPPNKNVKLTKFLPNVNILRYAIKVNNVCLLEKQIFNVLEKSTIELCQECLTIKNFLARHSIVSSVTGSGSAVFTVSKKCIPKKVQKNLLKKWLGFQVQTF